MTHKALLAFALPAAAALAAPVVAAPSPFTDLASVDNAVAAFTGQPIGVPGGAATPVDRRLRLARCNAPLALSWRGDRHDSILVQCPDAGGWRLYVAVSGNSQPGFGLGAAAPVVSRGDMVTIALTGDGFSVSQPGEALEGGAVGSWIRVRTAAKADPMRARIVRPGLVEMPIE
jgi:flagella basal body P-ring formation protein FlgA